jgi:predicted helicase
MSEATGTMQSVGAREPGTLGYLLCQLDVDRALRGRQFERVCQWYLLNDPTYASVLRRVWLWDEWPGRWGQDSGIDLVAEDHQGQLWAIQAKAYAPGNRITKTDVNTFLAESGLPQFSYRLLIATTDQFSPIGKRTLQAQEKPVGVITLAALEAAAIDWPHSPDELDAPPRVRAMPHPYQQEAIDNVVAGLEAGGRGQLIMACGTGKTLTALFIKEKLAASCTLVLVPSLALLGQTLCEWKANATEPFAWCAVCSDTTVAEPDSADTASTSNSDLGVPVITDPAAITAFLCSTSGPRVVFATYQSSPKIVEALHHPNTPVIDLVIADEAHRCTGRAASAFATVLDDTAIPAQRRLFMTATPRYFTDRVRNVADSAGVDVVSMDDQDVFGPVLHRLSFAEAIRRELLTDYRVVVVCVDNAEYRQWVHDGRLVTRDGAKITDATTLAAQIGLAKAMRQYDLHRVITFHSRVSRARDFAASMSDVIDWLPEHERPDGDVWADYASGAMPAGQRHAKLQRLRNVPEAERGLLANARCLAEGVDVPALDGIAFIDPRSAEVDIIQAVGRAIRLAPDKTIGTIVIPVFIDSLESADAALDNDTAFKPVWDVIKALRAHDEDLGIRIDQLRLHAVGRSETSSTVEVLDKIDFADVPEHLNSSFAAAFETRLVAEVAVPSVRQHKVRLSLDLELKKRMANTIAHTKGRKGVRFQSQFVQAAIADLCRELEIKYNGGDRFAGPSWGDVPEVAGTTPSTGR